MSSPGSVTLWLHWLKEGDQEALWPLWERYFSQLVRMAHKRLDRVSRRIVDGEDIVASAFDSFVRGVERRRFPRLNDRDDLWQVLLRITSCKVIDWYRIEHAEKRGGDRVIAVSQIQPAGSEDLPPWDGIGREPDPQEAVALAESCEQMLGMLDRQLQEVALWRLEGYENKEIAEKMGCVEKTVERKLKRIRTIWKGFDPRLSAQSEPEGGEAES